MSATSIDTSTNTSATCTGLFARNFNIFFLNKSLLLFMFEWWPKETKFTSLFLCGLFRKHWLELALRTARGLDHWTLIIGSSTRPLIWDDRGNLSSVSSIFTQPYYFHSPEQFYFISLLWMKDLTKRLSKIYFLSFSEVFFPRNPFSASNFFHNFDSEKKTVLKLRKIFISLSIPTIVIVNQHHSLQLLLFIVIDSWCDCCC